MAGTDFKDYYGVLGISKTASVDDLKQAYRKLARKYHPDVNPGNKQAEARFKEVNEAYEVLSDPDKRKKYDQFGQYWQQSGTGQPWAGSSSGANVNFENVEFGQYASFDEFINQLLGRFGGPTPPGASGYSSSYRASSTGSGFGGFNDYAGASERTATANLDREAPISLTLSEAFRGTQKRLSVGAETMEVRIPAGVQPGSRVRVKGKGAFNSQTQQRGDLYLIIQLQTHAFFQFDGDMLVCEVPIAPDEAVLGGAIDVPTPDGMVTMNVPAGVRSGQVLRLRGKGWPKPKQGRGDQLVRLVIIPPKELTTFEREAYEKLKANRSYNPRNHLKQVQL
jgi:curved DNA-binding protein